MRRGDERLYLYNSSGIYTIPRKRSLCLLVAIRQLASHAEKNQDVLNKDPAQPTQIKMYFSDSSYLADLLQFVQYTIVHLSTFLSGHPLDPPSRHHIPLIEVQR